MSKRVSKVKKRNKKYAGVNAKQPTNLVRLHKVDAVVRSDLGQWMHDHRKIIKVVTIVFVIILVIAAGLATLF